ncbi:helix-turn-helix transcriptional regulator [Pleurocapsales cyanobacterium LEGE 10410]|nr:helix-turn-helix transcriptional regulator [Pleurocapsales cyanobacterium LEGE 10410]
MLHSDKSDRIMVCPSHLGQGYFQQIELNEDLTLEIFDYTLSRDIVIEAASVGNPLKFEFQLSGADAGYSRFSPNFGLKQLWIERSRHREMRAAIVFKPPILMTYFQKFMSHLPPHIYCLAERVIKFLYQYQNGYTISSTAEMLDRVLHNAIAPNAYQTFEQILIDDVYSQIPVLDCVARNPITPAMKQVIEQILSCPYQGANRRAYLEQKALKLVTLYLETMLQPHLDKFDLSSIYQAETILPNQSTNPPTIEMLARQIGTNRSKLNQGFHQVYGVTPYGYLRRCRMRQARRLLLISDLSVEEVALTVGYRSRSRFATAFRQDFGINPKAFQIQAWQCA